MHNNYCHRTCASFCIKSMCNLCAKCFSHKQMRRPLSSSCTLNVSKAFRRFFAVSVIRSSIDIPISHLRHVRNSLLCYRGNDIYQYVNIWFSFWCFFMKFSSKGLLNNFSWPGKVCQRCCDCTCWTGIAPAWRKLISQQQITSNLYDKSLLIPVWTTKTWKNWMQSMVKWVEEVTCTWLKYNLYTSMMIQLNIRRNMLFYPWVFC